MNLFKRLVFSLLLNDNDIKSIRTKGQPEEEDPYLMECRICSRSDTTKMILGGKKRYCNCCGQITDV